MQALDGFLTPLQKQLILQVINHIDDMTKRIGQMDDLVKRCTGGYEEALEKLDKIPAGGNGYRHESVCNGEASVQLGRSVFGEQRECRKAAQQQDCQRERHVEPMRQSGHQEESPLPVCAI